MIILTLLKYIVHTAALLLLLRFLFQLWDVSIRSPEAQTIVRIGNSSSQWLRNKLPFHPRVDAASLLLCIVLLSVWLGAATYFLGVMTNPLLYLVWGLIGAFSLLLQLYFFIFIAFVVLSWVAPHSRHPLVILIQDLSIPIVSPVRNLIPSFAGLDFSPMVIFLIIWMLRSWFLPLISQITGFPLFLGI